MNGVGPANAALVLQAGPAVPEAGRGGRGASGQQAAGSAADGAFATVLGEMSGHTAGPAPSTGTFAEQASPAVLPASDSAADAGPDVTSGVVSTSGSASVIAHDPAAGIALGSDFGFQSAADPGSSSAPEPGMLPVAVVTPAAVSDSPLPMFAGPSAAALPAPFAQPGHSEQPLAEQPGSPAEPADVATVPGTSAAGQGHPAGGPEPHDVRTAPVDYGLRTAASASPPMTAATPQTPPGDLTVPLPEQAAGPGQAAAPPPVALGAAPESLVRASGTASLSGEQTPDPKAGGAVSTAPAAGDGFDALAVQAGVPNGSDVRATAFGGGAAGLATNPVALATLQDVEDSGIAQPSGADPSEVTVLPSSGGGPAAELPPAPGTSGTSTVTSTAADTGTSAGAVQQESAFLQTPAASTAPQAAAQPAASQASVPSAAQPPLQSQVARPLFTLAAAPNGQHTMTLQLAPEGLGPLTVRADIDAAGVRIELFASGDIGREAIRSILPELRKELAQAGFGASLDVSDRSGPGNSGQDGAARNMNLDAGQDNNRGNRGPGPGAHPGEQRSGHPWEQRPDEPGPPGAAHLNGPRTILDIFA